MTTGSPSASPSFGVTVASQSSPRPVALAGTIASVKSVGAPSLVQAHANVTVSASASVAVAVASTSTSDGVVFATVAVAIGRVFAMVTAAVAPAPACFPRVATAVAVQTSPLVVRSAGTVVAPSRSAWAAPSTSQVMDVVILSASG